MHGMDSGTEWGGSCQDGGRRSRLRSESKQVPILMKRDKQGLYREFPLVLLEIEVSTHAWKDTIVVNDESLSRGSNAYLGAYCGKRSV